MENTYIIVSRNTGRHDCFSALGHEIHLTRFILYDLLQKDKIDTNVTIVTLSEDRFFLYSNVFKKLISWNNFLQNNSNKNIIDLCFYSPWHSRFEKIDFFKQVNYSFDMFEKTDKFIKYINDIQYCNLENYSFTNRIYYMICVRFKTDNDKLHKLINKIHKIHENSNSSNKETECNIVVYASDIPQISEPNVHVINNLQTYASLLNNNNCKLLISEWSGGGQLSQYCNNNNIVYYFDNYTPGDYVSNYQNYQKESNKYNNIFDCWDFKTTTMCKRLYYESLSYILKDDILNYILTK